MKLKRIVALVLSVATVAGTGAMAAFSASAKNQWSVESKSEVNRYRSGNTYPYLNYDSATLKLGSHATIKYKLTAASYSKWIVCAGDDTKENTNKTYCYMYGDPKGTWCPEDAETLMVHAGCVDKNGNAKSSMKKNYYEWFHVPTCVGERNALYTEIKTDWNRQMVSGSFTAKYKDYKFEVVGAIRK